MNHEPAECHHKDLLSSSSSSSSQATLFSDPRVTELLENIGEDSFGARSNLDDAKTYLDSSLIEHSKDANEIHDIVASSKALNGRHCKAETGCYGNFDDFEPLDSQNNDERDCATARTQSSSSSWSSASLIFGNGEDNYQGGADLPTISSYEQDRVLNHDSLAEEEDLDDFGSFTPIDFDRVESLETSVTPIDFDWVDSLETSVTNKTPAVCFGSIKHPGTTKWRIIVSEYSSNTVDFPRWSDEIAACVQKHLEHEGIVDYFVAVRKRILNEEKHALGRWRQATTKEILQKTRQRFLDERKARLKSNRYVQGRPSRSRLFKEDNSSARLPVAMANQSVCFDWNRHPGTTTWWTIVKEIADNTIEFPTWEASIVNRVKEELAEHDVTSFLVFLDSEGKPCMTIGDGLWFQASDSEIHERTRQLFLTLRCQEDGSLATFEAEDYIEPAIKSEPIDTSESLPLDDATNIDETDASDDGSEASMDDQSFASSSDTVPGLDVMSSSAATDCQNVLDLSCNKAGCTEESKEPVDIAHCENNEQALPFSVYSKQSNESEAGDKRQFPNYNPSSLRVINVKHVEPPPKSALTSNATPCAGKPRLLHSAARVPTKTDVCFGWIKHHGTKIWRDAVKMFSENGMLYPTWSDDICDQVTEFLSQNNGIGRFLICRDSAGFPLRKIFDARKELLGIWCEATVQEIADKTRQRFLNDRKPRYNDSLSMSKKRPRGRPSKKRRDDYSISSWTEDPDCFAFHLSSITDRGPLAANPFEESIR